MLLARRVGGLVARAAVRTPALRAATAAADAPVVTADAVASPFLKEFVARGYLAQCTDLEGLDEKMAAGPISASRDRADVRS